MPKSTFLKNCLPRLTTVLLLCLFTVASFAEESRPPWKIAIFRSNSPRSIETEQALKNGLVKLSYVESQNLTYLPTVIQGFAGPTAQVVDHEDQRGRR